MIHFSHSVQRSPATFVRFLTLAWMARRTVVAGLLLWLPLLVQARSDEQALLVRSNIAPSLLQYVTVPPTTISTTCAHAFDDYFDCSYPYGNDDDKTDDDSLLNGDFDNKNNNNYIVNPHASNYDLPLRKSYCNMIEAHLDCQSEARLYAACSWKSLYPDTPALDCRAAGLSSPARSSTTKAMGNNNVWASSDAVAAIPGAGRSNADDSTRTSSAANSNLVSTLIGMLATAFTSIFALGVVEWR